MALNPPGLSPALIGIDLCFGPQITVDVADAAVKKAVPFPFTVVGVTGTARSIGGDVPPTGLAVQIMLNEVELVAALPVVAASAIARPEGTLALSGEALNGAAGDFLHMKLLNVTGGTNPTIDGLEATVWLARR